MRILLLLLTSMFLYSCGNKNSATDYDDYDLETPCGCAGFMYRLDEEWDTCSMERAEELEDMYQNEVDNCRKVIAVFEKDEIRVYLRDDSVRMHVDLEAVEEAILNTDHFNGCEEAAIEISHDIAYEMTELLNEDY